MPAIDYAFTSPLYSVLTKHREAIEDHCRYLLLRLRAKMIDCDQVFPEMIDYAKSLVFSTPSEKFAELITNDSSEILHRLVGILQDPKDDKRIRSTLTLKQVAQLMFTNRQEVYRAVDPERYGKRGKSDQLGKAATLKRLKDGSFGTKDVIKFIKDSPKFFHLLTCVAEAEFIIGASKRDLPEQRSVVKVAGTTGSSSDVMKVLLSREVSRRSKQKPISKRSVSSVRKKKLS